MKTREGDDQGTGSSSLCGYAVMMNWLSSLFKQLDAVVGVPTFLSPSVIVCVPALVRWNRLCIVLTFLLLHRLLQEYTSPAQTQTVSGRMQSQAGDSRSVIAIRNQVRSPPLPLPPST